MAACSVVKGSVHSATPSRRGSPGRARPTGARWQPALIFECLEGPFALVASAGPTESLLAFLVLCFAAP